MATMDIAYLFKADIENDSEELRYSLRSLKNIPHGKVFIIGEKPDWVTNVEYIPVSQSKTKGENVMMNLFAAVRSAQISDDFIIMNDDFFIMKKIQNMPNLNFGDMKDLIMRYMTRYPEGSGYIDNMKKLYEVLVERGYKQPISYELHVPMVINKQKVKELRQCVDGSLYQFRTFYGNYFHIGGETASDVKVFIDSQHNDPSYNNDPEGYLSRQSLLSATGGSFKKGIAGDFIRRAFPEKSTYEI